MTLGETVTVAVVTAVLTALLVTPVSIYLTAWLGVKRFRVEKWWEKRALVYEEIFESLHDYIEYYDKQMESYELGKSYSKEYMSELGELSRKARANILKRQRIGSFIISDRAEMLLLELERELNKSVNQENWYDYVDHCLLAAIKAFDDLKTEARRDLGRVTTLPGENVWAGLRERIRNRPGQPDLGASVG